MLNSVAGRGYPPRHVQMALQFMALQYGIDLVDERDPARDRQRAMALHEAATKPK